MSASFGPYRIDDTIGRGGMGEVVRAYDTEHRRVVALERLPEGLGSDEGLRARFRREAELYPLIVPVAFGAGDGFAVTPQGTVHVADGRAVDAVALPPR